MPQGISVVIIDSDIDSINTMVKYMKSMDSKVIVEGTATTFENGFELVPLGQGELDCNEYIKAMKDAGWTDYITVEVSVMVWSNEGYDPLSVASISYDTVNKAFKSAGVPRE